MASHTLIDTYLADLARHRLPADAVDELADGLTETFQNRIDQGLAPQSVPWPMTFAIPASLARVGLSLRHLLVWSVTNPGS